MPSPPAEVPIVFDFDFNFNEDFDMSSTMPEADVANDEDDGNDGNEGNEGNDEDDEDSDNDHSDTDTSTKVDSSVKKRPTIREHSKAQREKRKTMLEELERDAAVVTKQKEEKDAQYQVVFNSIENKRKIYLRNIALFLQSWFGAAISDSISVIENSDPDEIYSPHDPLDENKSSWVRVVDIDTAVVTMPLTMAFWVPPIISSSSIASPSPNQPRPPRHQRLNLKTFALMKGYKAGYSLLCSSIARYPFLCALKWFLFMTPSSGKKFSTIILMILN